MTYANAQIVEFIARIFLGILFLFQGYDKLFGVKMKSVVHAFQSEATLYHIPHSLLVFISYLTSITEFAGGVFLLLGLFTNLTLIALGADLLIVAFAFSYMQPMWDMKHVFPRLILLLFLLLLPQENSILGLDYFLKRN